MLWTVASGFYSARMLKEWPGRKRIVTSSLVGGDGRDGKGNGKRADQRENAIDGLRTRARIEFGLGWSSLLPTFFQAEE